MKRGETRERAAEQAQGKAPADDWIGLDWIGLGAFARTKSRNPKKKRLSDEIFASTKSLQHLFLPVSTQKQQGREARKRKHETTQDAYGKVRRSNMNPRYYTDIHIYVPPNDRSGLADLGHLVQDREDRILELLVSLWCLVIVRPEVNNNDITRSGIVEVLEGFGEPVGKIREI